MQDSCHNASFYQLIHAERDLFDHRHSTHRQMTDEQLLACGVSPDLVRFSVGIEDAEDIIADIEQALAKI